VVNLRAELVAEVVDSPAAWCFLRACCDYFGYGFHPDTQAEDYVDENGSPIFTPEEVDRFNFSMERIFVRFENVYEAVQTLPPFAEAPASLPIKSNP
jgi:hypothetical protein